MEVTALDMDADRQQCRPALAAQARLREKGFTPGELLPFRR